MSLNGVNNSATNYNLTNKTSTYKTSSKDETKKSSLDEAAAYVPNKDEANINKSDSKQKIYKRDDATIESLKADADRRTSQLRSLVEKMMTKQGQVFNDATDMYALLREGKLKVDPAVSKQAQADIAEDGYWGVEQTSDRLVSFAKALTGGDPAMVDKMKNAMIKGFKEAAKAWGGNLPDISQRTYDAAIKKFDDWANESVGNTN